MSQHSSQKPTKHIKEYIYVDNLEINSILAQFEDGIPKVIEEIKQSTETNTEGVSQKASGNAKIGASFGLKGEVSVNNDFRTNNSEATSDMYQEAISTVYHDYAVKIVTDELDSSNLLKTTTKQPEGSFVQLTSKFDIIDPVTIGSRLDDETVSFMLSLAENDGADSDDTNDAQVGFNLITQFGNLLNKFFPDSMLISVNNALTITEKQNFRMNESQLKSLVLANRKITILGKIESIIQGPDLDSVQIANNMMNNPSSFATLMPRFSFFVLAALGIIKKDDRLIKPIAIYFD